MGKGTGDLYIRAFSSDRIIQSESFVVEDCIKYIASETYTISTTNDTVWTICSFENEPVEVSYTAKTTRAGASIHLAKETGTLRGYGFVFSQVDAQPNYIKCIADEPTIYTSSSNYSLNTDYNFKVTANNGVITYYLEGNQVATTSTTDNLIYLLARSWVNTKTITITDLKIKPL